MKPPKTWILIANGGEAVIAENHGRMDGVRLIDGYHYKNELLPPRDIMADKPGRTFDRVGGGRHAMEYSSDPAGQGERRFARQLSEVLDKAQKEDRFDRLVIAAAPSMLANLRDTLLPATRACLHAEIDKDYTKTPVADLAHLLRRVDAID